jgi:hypothetical protein
MANESQAVILSELRNAATQFHEAIYKIRELRDRFDAFGGEPAFKGASKLFVDDTTPVGGIVFPDFLGVFTGESAAAADSEYPALVAVTARARG